VLHDTATPTIITRARRNRGVAAALAVVTLALLGACGGDDGGDARAEAQAASDNTVTMELIRYRPETLDIAAGVTVTWTQKDAGVHTVTSGTVEQGAGGVTTVPDGRFDSGEITTGRTFTFTFDRPGTYRYFCSVHPATMRGEVRVR
jgi:plastocyanin